MLKKLNIQLFAGEDLDTGSDPVQPQSEPIVPTQTPTETVTETPAVITPQEPTQPVDNLIEIEGLGKLSAKEIKEWKQGYLRQSDYTKKTQELAQSKQEVQDAVLLYEYLKANPHVARKLQETEVVQQNPDIVNKFDPAYNRIEKLETKIASYELDMEINRLKGIYPDFDEVSVLREASKRGVTDLEFVYKALNSKPNNDIRSQIEAEVRQKLLEEIKNNAQQTQTIISTNDIPSVKTYSLTKDEERIAKAFIEQGVFENIDEYVKYKNS